MVAKMKADLMPVIDSTLTAYVVGIESTMKVASEQEIDRCIAIVEATMRPVSEGRTEWNAALKAAADALRSWKKSAGAP